MNTKRPEEAKGIDHHLLPVGKVIAGMDPTKPIRGKYQAMPLFGYVSLRDKTDTPLVMLTVLLMKVEEGDISVAGSMSLELPVFPETETGILWALERLGWDGRVWPVDDGWPHGDEANEMQLLELMENAKLRASLTFPPSDVGAAAIEVDVQRANGPFLMPPLPEPEAPGDPVKLAKLRAMCENPKVFFDRPQKPAVFN